MATISQAIRIAQAAIETGVVPIFKGAPGVGKSSLAYQLARTMGFDPDNGEFAEFRPNLHDPVDLMGLPSKEEDRMVYLTPNWLPKEGKGLLFIDEFPQATPAMQNALSQLILDRRIGEYRLPDGWAIVAAGNRLKDRAATSKMPTHIANRFQHIDIEFSLEDFVKWCIDEQQPEQLIAFAKFRPTVLESFNPDKEINCTPRSLVSAAKLINMDDELQMEAIKGLIGEGAAGEFVAFLKVWKDLPDPEKVVQNPEKYPVPDETKMDVLYAIVQALCAHTKIDNFASILKYIKRVPNELGVMYVRDVIVRNPRIATDPNSREDFRQWTRDNNLLLEA